MISSQDGTEERRPFAVFLAPGRGRFDASSAAGSSAGPAAATAGAGAGGSGADGSGAATETATGDSVRPAAGPGAGT